jgi:hypothetical protein
VRMSATCRHILSLHCPFLLTVHDEVKSDLNVFGFVMEHWIFRELDAALIVIVDDNSVQPNE